MRVLQVIFTAIFAVIVIIGGFLAAVIVGAAGLLIVLVRRLLGRPPALQPRTPGPASRHAQGDVIDVSATEIPPAESPNHHIDR